MYGIQCTRLCSVAVFEKRKINLKTNIDMKKETSNLPQNEAMQYEPLLCPVFLDKHGLTIKDGDIIQNLYNVPARQQVELIQGELWFGAEGTTLNTPDNDWVKLGKEHGTDKFWEVVS